MAAWKGKEKGTEAAPAAGKSLTARISVAALQVTGSWLRHGRPRDPDST